MLKNIDELRAALKNINAEPLEKEDMVARRLQIHFGITKEEALLLSAKLHMKHTKWKHEHDDDEYR
jgi:hypothetical protein